MSYIPWNTMEDDEVIHEVYDKYGFLFSIKGKKTMTDMEINAFASASALDEMDKIQDAKKVEQTPAPVVEPVVI